MILKKILTIMLVVSSSMLNAQKMEKIESEAQELAPIICDCLIELSPSSTIEEKFQKFILRCFSNTIRMHQLALYDPNSTLTDYEQGRKIGEIMYEKISGILINECDTYYNFAKKVVPKVYVLSPKKHKKQIESISSKLIHTTLKEEKRAKLLQKRGINYEAIKEFKKAEEDYKAAWELTKDHPYMMQALIAMRKSNTNEE